MPQQPSQNESDLKTKDRSVQPLDDAAPTTLIAVLEAIEQYKAETQNK
jgi:hypothetical protein